MLHQWTKFQCHAFSSSQDIKPNVLLDSWWRQTLRFIFDQALKQWLTGRKRGEDGNAKNRIFSLGSDKKGVWLTTDICPGIFKACVYYFHQFFFDQMIALQKLWKMLLILSTKFFSFPRFSIFCISILPFFPICRPLL